MKRIDFVFLLLIFQFGAYTQDYHVVDSLERLLQNEHIQDTNTVMRYLYLGGEYLWSVPDTAIYYDNKALSLSRQLHFTHGEFFTLENRAFPLALVREDSAAVSSAYEAIAMAEAANNNQFITQAYLTLGSVYLHLKEFDKGILYHRKALSYFDGSYYPYFFQAYDEHLAQCFLGLNKTDSAFYYVNKTLADDKQIQFNNGYDWYLMGNVFLQKALPDSALEYYREGLAMVTKQHVLKDMADCDLGIANAFLQKNMFDSAIYYAKNGWIAASNIRLPNEKLDALNLLTTVFASQKNIDSAYRYQQYALALKDSIYSAAKVRQVQLLSFNEEMRKQQEAEVAKKRRNTDIIIALVALLLFTIIIATIIYRNNRQRKKAFALLQKQKEQIQNTLSELKSTQQQLIQSEKMASLGELTAGIAHEIQNPLNFVNNFSEVNKEMLVELNEEIDKGNYDDAKSIAKDVIANEEKINHHGKRADAIVKNMLQHSRQTSGTKEPTDINALCDEYLRLSYHGLRARDKEFNADFKTDFDESIDKINIVPQDIGRVLLNLYNNAFYAVNEKQKAKNLMLNIEYKPTVSVETKQTDNKIEIVVKDNGNGIPQKVVDKIFQPFFTTKPTGEGTGLGLSLSYDIIKAHGGEIRVESKEGEGSWFEIQLHLTK